MPVVIGRIIYLAIAGIVINSWAKNVAKYLNEKGYFITKEQATEIKEKQANDKRRIKHKSPK